MTTAVTALAAACRDVFQPGEHRLPFGLSRRATVVTPDSMAGWAFYDDQNDTLCTVSSSCRFAQAPVGGPGGQGSAELAVSSAAESRALIFAGFSGTRFDSITSLSYATYRQSADPNNNLAISLQFNVDYDLADGSSSYMGRIVFEPYQGAGGNVPDATWQTWNALGGRWWGTKSSVTVANAQVSNPCVHATPCTWPQLLAAFPNIGVHATYGAVVLKAGAGWGMFRGYADRLTIGASGNLTEFDFETSAVGVPSVAPPTLPADLNVLDSAVDLGAGTVYAHKNLVWVTFAATANLSAKQAAVAAVGGTVVGGRPGGAGDDVYLIRISQSIAPLRAAFLLRSAAGVRSAAPVMFVEEGTTYRKPRDGAGWRVWKLNPDSTVVGQANWQMQALDLPRAWGCSVGSLDTKVRVIDARIHALGSGTNITSLSSEHDEKTPLNGNPTTWHGDAVTRVLAERGNDGAGMTGVMWHADVRQTDVQAYDPVSHEPLKSPKDTTKRLMRLFGIDSIIRDAAKNGERVINISLGAGMASTTPVALRDSIATVVAGHVSQGLLAAEGYVSSHPAAFVPLVVISAGNDGADAANSGFPVAAQDFQVNKYVIVVTSGMQNSTQLAPEANNGSLVSIAAPGENIHVTDPSGADMAVSGTSFATPAVAGIAGLIVDFDARLSADSIKQILIAGAVNGGRNTAGFPVANAYESLKLTAQRSGAPLCGNRLWVEGDQVRVQRTGASIETVVSSGIAGSAYLSAYHGGKRFDLDYWREFIWYAGTWTEVRPPDVQADSEQNGAFWSYNQMDHDAAQSVSGTIRRDGSGSGADTAIVTFVDSMSVTKQFRLSFPVSRPPLSCVADTASFAPDHTYITNACSNFQRLGTWDDVEGVGQNGSNGLFPVLAPQADFILLPIARMRRTLTASSSYNCEPPGTPAGVHDHCWRGSFSDSALSLTVYKIRISDGSVTPVALDATGQTTRDRAYFEWLEVSESGDQLVIATGEHVRKGIADFLRRGGVTEGATSWICANGLDEWISMSSATGAPAGTRLFAVSRPDPDPCAGNFEGGSTVAGRRGPRLPTPPANGRLTPSTTRRR